MIPFITMPGIIETWFSRKKEKKSEFKWYDLPHTQWEIVPEITEDAEYEIVTPKQLTNGRN